MSFGLWVKALFCLMVSMLRRASVCVALVVAACLLTLQSAFATTFTTTVPGTAITIPSTYPQAGGVVIVLEGVNGNVYYQFVNPSTMFQGYQNAGAPAAWNGNPFQIGPTMTLNCGPVVSCSSYLGGGLTRMSVRFTAYDGDNQVGQFDYNNLNMRFNGSNFGASNGNWSVVATQNTDITGTTLISSNTGYGNNTLDTGWFQSSDQTILNSILTSGTITATVFDSDPNDNYWDFKRGNDAVTSTVPLNVAPGVTLDKASTTTSFTTVGQVIPYTFTYRNVGSVWINNVAISDPKVTGVTCPALPAATTANLDPAEQVICTANYTVTQADIDAGSIVNTATATGTPQAGSLGPVTDTNTIQGPLARPEIDLTKTATPSPFGAVGSNITYAFAIRNAGNVTLSSVVVTDPKLPSLSCTIPSIAPGITVNASCTGNTTTVTQAMVDAGSVSNTATVTSRSPSNAVVNDTSNVVLTGPTQLRSLSLDKTSPTTNYNAVGNVLTYSYLLRNTGNVTLTGTLSVTDNKTTVSCPALPVTGLAPNATLICSASYTVTLADLNAGSVVNTANAAIGATAAPSDQVTVPAVQLPAMTVDKTSPTTNFDSVGDVLTYAYLVRNTGNVTLTNPVTIADNKASVTCPALPAGGLVPNATLNCSAAYTVTQADIDAGSVVNTASASTTFGAGNTPVNSPTDQVTIPAIKTPALTIDKSETAVNFVNVGDTVSYSYLVTNSGNTTLTAPITVSDNRVTPVTCPALPVGGLAPGGSVTCTANYSVLVEDLDIGSITNIASAASGPVTSAQDAVTVPSGANPAISVDKTSLATSFNNLGDVISYGFLVTNTGNATLTRAINISDTKIGTISCWVPPTTGPAADRVFTPGETLTCSGDYTITQADLDAGFVTNQANAATTYGAANVPVTSPPDSLTINAEQDPSLRVIKSAATLPVTAVGQVLTYTVTAENNGDVTLSNVNITDPLIPSMNCTVASLAVGSSTDCVGSYTATQADFDAGQIANTAQATATTPQGTPVSNTGSLTTNVIQNSSITTFKDLQSYADNDSSSSVSLNDTLTYVVIATNDGNITQTNVVITDTLLTPSSKTCATVAPGSTCELTGTLNVTQAYVDAGSILNTATITSTLLPTLQQPSSFVAIPRISSLSLDKQTPVNGDQDSSATITLNDVLTYTVVATNTGNVTQTNVTVADAQLTPASTVCASVAPGATCTLVGTKTVSQTNVDAGQVVNNANVTSTLVTSPVNDSVTTPVAQNSSLAIAKTLTSNADQDASNTISVNDTLTYTVTATNDGTVTQNNVVVTDALLTPSSNTCATLAPGAACVLSGTYTVSQTNVNVGQVDNTGSVTSTRLPTPETIAISTPIPQTRSVSVDKSSSTTNFDAVGDVVSYSYLVTNTGNVTLTGAVSVADDKTTVTCPTLPVAGLAPGATHTCTATYSVTQADLNAGFVLNTASATVGTTTSPTDQVNVPAMQLPALTIDKTSSTPSFSSVGEVLSYSYVVRNSGNVTLTSAITVSDDKTTVSCPALPGGKLDPTQTITCSASYTVTQADIDAGQVSNTASASSGATTSPTDRVDVPAVQTPSMSMVKTATSIAFNNIGDTVSYEYVITNTGNTTLTDTITVTDNRISPVKCDDLPVGGLVPGDKLNCTADYTVQLEDLEVASLTNLAFATSGRTNSPQTSETIPPDADPALTLSKSSTVTKFDRVGEVIKYSFVVQNTGKATFTRLIEVVDDKIGTIACWTPTSSAPVFIPNDTVTCAANYTITQDDMDRGYVTNQASAATTYGAARLPITSPPQSLKIDASQDPGLFVTKSATTLPVAAVGQVLTYTVTAENNGDVTLTNVNITDPLIPSMNCTVASLAVGDSTNCVGTYTVTQADFDAGQIANTATATAVTPQGAPVSSAGGNTVPITQVSSVSIGKVLDSNADQDASTTVSLDDTLTYTITVRNDGNVTQNNVVVTDALLTPSSTTCATLAPGGICALTGTLNVTQTRVDAGAVNNSASVTTTRLPTAEIANAVVPVPQVSSMTIDKQVPSNGDQDDTDTITLNDELTYTVVATNTGNVTQTAVTVSDPQLTPSSLVCSSVAPGDVCILIGTKNVTQAEVNAGSIVNTASVTSALITIPLTDGVATPVAQNSSLSIAKVVASNADQDGSNSITLDDTLTYTVTATNDGTVTQNAVVVTDTLLTPGSITCGSLEPGESCILTGTYTVTQTNVDAGTIGNIGSVTSTLLPTAETISINTPVPQNPAVTIDKTSTTTNFDAVGDTIAYSYLLTNSGNVTLKGSVSVADDKTTVTCPTLPTTGLAPAATHTCTASYTVTQADLNTGFVLNTASATIGATTSLTDQVNVPALQEPALTVHKTSPTASYDSVGDVLTYSYEVRNTGNVTLTSAISVTDDKATVTCPALPVGGLAPNSTITCSASYTVTQADIDAGQVVNTASASDGTTTSPTDQVSVPAVQSPALSVVKNATAVAFNNVGDTVSYEYVVTNAGNTTLKDAITVSDNRVATVNCPALPVGGLAPGATLTCTADYTVVLADLDLGSLTNLASATSGTTTSPQTSETVPSGATQALTISKASTSTTFNSVGDVLPYDFTVTNSGNATFTRVINVVDDKIGTIACFTPSPGDPTFTPGETINCSANYTVKQEDLDAGFVTNQATAQTTFGATNIAVSSAPDDLTINAIQNPELTVTKSAATLPVTAVGQVLTYTVTAENSGDVTLSDVKITDPLIPAMSCNVASLAVSTSTNCVGTYTVTQTDFDAGQILNTAKADAVTPQGVAVTDSGDLTTPIAAPAPALTLVKTATIAAYAAVGDSITYNFAVTNSGDVTLTDVTVTDPLVPAFSCVIPTLAPAITDNSCSASYVVTQADINAGSVVNTALVTGTAARGADPSASAGETVPGPVRAPRVSVAKSASPLTYGSVGDVIDYEYLVTNTGNVSLTGAITISDDKLSSVSCPALPLTGLLPGNSQTCTASHTITLADLNAGSITNIATANANSVLGALSSAPDSVSVNAVPAPAITVVKSAGAVTDLDGNGTDAGDTIAYSFLVSNKGNVTLTSVGVTDLKVGTVSCPFALLDPGASTTCTATYALTLADVNAGQVTNTAEASGTPPTGPVVKDVSGATENDDAPTVTSFSGNAAIAVVKSAGAIDDLDGNGADVGDTIEYTFTVSNQGSVTLTSIGVVDPKVGTVSCPVTSLDPGASTICTATYTLILVDVNASRVTNTATASGTPPSGPVVSDISGNAIGDDTPTVTPILQAPSIAVTKAASPIADLDANGPDAGDTIGYTFNVRNTGNVTLTSIGVSDPKVGPVLCGASSLAPATSTSCSATYVLTQADVNAGQVQNSAIASGTPPTGPAVSDTSGTGLTDNTPTVSPITQTPSLSVVKTSPTSSFDSVGDVLTYSYIVRNTGNVTLTDAVTVTDDKTSVSCPAMPVGGLAPSATLTCSATYTVAQADIDAGSVVNTASAATTFGPSGTAVTSPTDDATVPAVQNPSMSVVKNATSVNFVNIGDTVDYEYIVTNTGNTTIVNQLTVNDNRVSPVNCPSLPPSGLPPGASRICTATYSLVVEDLDVGSVTNLASATDGITTSPTTSETVPSAATPALTISKTSTSTSTSFDAVGDVIPYSFQLSNSGSATFTRAISVTDNKIGLVACFTPSAADLTFIPGETLTCSGNYTVTQADIDRGFVTNEAYASTTYGLANIPVTSPPDVLTINAIQNPELTVSKSATTLPVTAVNQVLTYTVTAENTGDVTLSNVSISDPLIPSMSCTVASLVVGARSNCVGTYTVTQADFDAGQIVNTALATASTPQGTAVSDTGTNTVVITPTPAVAVVKTAGSIVDLDGNGPDEGDEINYSFAVSNEGDVTLSSIAVTDVKVGAVNCPTTSVAPGLSAICSATYSLTQDDVNAGEVVNTARVTAQPPRGGSVADTSGSAVDNDTPTTTSIPSNPLIALVKSASTVNDLDGNGADAGDRIDYTFTVSNEGNQTLTDLTINDAKISGVSCPVTSLTPAASTNCAASYTLLQTDIDAGIVTNSATATADDPNGTPISDVSGTTKSDDTPTVTNLPRTSGITVVKSPGVLTDSDNNGADVGDTLTYAFEIANTGNQTLTGITVSDLKATVLGGPLAILPPGTTDTSTFTATYVLTQADVDAANVTNTATVRGNPPTGPPVTDVSGTSSNNDLPTDTPLSRAPALTLVKTANGINDLDGNGPDVGDTVSYDFEVTNTGNVSLSNISINDPLVGLAALERANDVSTLVAMAATGVDTMTTASTSKLTDAETNTEKQSLPVKLSEMMFGRANVPLLPSAVHVERKLVRLSNRTGELIAGENLGIYFTLTNSGEGVLTSIAATQDGAEGLGSDLDLLAPNTSDALPMVFAYTVTEQDIAAGYIEKSGRVVAKSRTQVLETNVTDKLSLASVDSPNELLVGSISPASIPALAPGASTNFAGTYELTQADIDAGTVTNTAVASASAPGGGSVSDTSGTLNTNDLPTNITVPNAPAVALVKTAGTLADPDNNGTDVGDIIAYTFEVSNQGNVTLNSIAIADAKVGAVNCPQTTVAPTASVTCSATYSLTQADVDLGSVTNTADVTATTPGGVTVTDKSGATIGDDTPTVTTFPRNGGMNLVKTAAAPTIAAGDDPDIADAGDTIEYSFTVENSGNVTLTAVAVTDPKVPSISCPVTSLAPTESTVCLGSYTLTLADFDQGSVENTALATGTNPDGTQSSDISGTAKTNDTPTITTLPQTPAVTLVKAAAAPTTDAGSNTTVVDVGDTIEYTFTVANTGNVSLTGINVNDAKLPAVTCAATNLAPGLTTTCTGIYTITQVDLDAGTVQNTAAVTGSSPDGTPADDTSGTDGNNDTPTDTALPQLGLIAIVKTASPVNDIDGNGVDIDDTIAYTFAVTNQGNVTLNAVAVEDDKVDAVVCPVTTLAPAETTNCTATYILTQEDIDRGQVENQATATGTPPSGTPVTDLSDPATPGQAPGENDPTITDLEQIAAITLVKVADVSALSTPAPLPGEKIQYSFTVKNTGNVTLENVTLADPLPGLVITGGASIVELLPGNSDSTTFKAEYAITAADIAAGRVENSAVVTGNYEDRNLTPQVITDTSGSAENNDDRTIVPLLAQPSVNLVKTATFNDITAPTPGANIGDTITYRFTVRNTGNVEVTNITVIDPLFNDPNAVRCLPDALAVGQQVECNSVTYALQNSDLSTGSITNTAVVNANAVVNGISGGVSDASGTAGGNDDPTITNLPIPTPNFSKTVNNGTAKVGDTLTFTIKGTAVAVSPVDIIDQLPGGLSFVKGSASINGTGATPTVSGRTITFSNVAPVGGDVTITLSAVVNASAKDGKITNLAKLLRSNGDLLAEARATVDIRPEPVFDCGDIIGKVFDDRNHNGLQDAGTSPYEPERGIPNVRVVTVTGTLITTDEHGRFHIPCADIPNKKVGSNFILKLDPRSLPSGYRMTTENPKVVRLTRGKLSKINFGATISRVIRLDLTDTVFTAGGLSVSPKLKAAVGKLVGILDEEQSTVRLQYHIGREGKAIAGRRLKLIEDYIAAQWQEKSGRYKLPIETRLVHTDKKASN
jgi:uncharacterized repeat protein (TIGR01451 family)